MTGIHVTLEAEGLTQAMAALNSLGDPRRVGEGLAQIGGLIESQTRRRFDERTSPDGEAWSPWSDTYRLSRRHGQSLLVASGAFRDSVAWDLSGDELRVGSNMVFAGLHQDGGTGDMAPGPAAVPARPWLGVSDDNAAEIEQALADWIEGTLQ
jgi:phage virion morphogenesis (putative tail completion) protein